MTDDTKIEHVDEGELGRYRLVSDGEMIGELAYVHTAPDRILASHTFVDPHRRQEGLARKLVDALVEDARLAGSLISPSCSYVRWVFEKNPEEFADVWDR